MRNNRITYFKGHKSGHYKLECPKMKKKEDKPKKSKRN